MHKKIYYSLTLSFLVLGLFLVSCNEDLSEVDPTESAETSEEIYSDSSFVATDWTDATHSKSADPNFDLIFDDNQVQRIDLVVTSNRWQLMLADMTSKYGPLGSSGNRPGGGLTELDENPIFIPAEVYYNGKQWYKVGIRFKGNSSLQSAWQSGNLKLSFKLDFDEFEDQYPQIDNQRFYGFKKLSLKNNYNDTSFLREKVAGEVFRNAGLAASHTAFYAVYLDKGDGPEYFGLYTLTEEVDDTVIDTQFSTDKGNLYKPDGDAASFMNGGFDEDELEKKTNEDEADFSDVKQLLSVLHDGSRTSSPAIWRHNLEAIFDTEVFLRYLAVNTTIQNWDTYGRMTHNYFLYNNPSNGLLTWIPWDNNEALEAGKNGGSLPLDFSSLSSTQWPLIGYLYQDPVYKATYEKYLQETIDGPFETNSMQALYSQYSSLVESYATSERNGYSFLRSSSEYSSAINSLKSHVSSRAAAVANYLK